jgi:hypothetical protein
MNMVGHKTVDDSFQLGLVTRAQKLLADEVDAILLSEEMLATEADPGQRVVMHSSHQWPAASWALDRSA